MAVLDVGMAYSGEYFGLQMTLASLREAVFLGGLDDDVTITVVDNLCDATADAVRSIVTGCGGNYIPFPTPIGTGPPRARLFAEPGAPWQLVIDDHVRLLHGDLAWLVDFCRGSTAPDLYFGPMLSTRVGSRGKPELRWTHHLPQWTEDGHFGKATTNPAAVDPDCPPFRIPHAMLGLFLCRREAWIPGLEDQRGFGSEGYLPLAFQQAGRAVWCLPHLRWTHCVRPQSVRPKRPNRWTDRAANALRFWQRLQPSPLFTFAGIKQTHCRTDRLTDKKWEAILQELQINEAEALARDPAPVIAAPRVVAVAATNLSPPADTTAWQTCRHRGEVIDQRAAKLCGRPKGELFPVHACALHGECVTSRTCMKQTERICYTCPDAVAADTAPIPAVAPTRRRPSDVAVVIPCHNYGRYLAEAIESLLQQSTPPAEIVVVDDASTDETAAVAERYKDRGVRYERIDARNVYVARRHGLACTTSPLVVFLDADDQLGPEYIERGLACFVDPRTAIAWTDLTLFGDETGLRRLPPANIEQRNYIHAGAMVRRVALEQSRAFEGDAVPSIRADLFVWRAVLRGGWTAQHFEATYRYRQHAQAMHHASRPMRYYELTHLQLETVTVFLPLSGRNQYWDRLRDWVEQQSWPRIEVVVIDSSGRPEFGRQVRQWLATLTCPTQYIHNGGVAGLADEDRRKPEHYRAVQQMMPRIYRHLQRTAQEYNLVLEDDVLPPRDAIERLLRGMQVQTACVSGVVRSRWRPHLIAWDEHIHSLSEIGQGVQKIGGTGFGCLLFRRSVFSQLVFHHGGEGNYDHTASADVRRLGYDWLIDWSVLCDHAGIPAAPSAPTAAAQRPHVAAVLPTPPVNGTSTLIAPVRGEKQPWRGRVTPKPWEYRVTAAIPVIDHPELLAIVIELLRLQTERPYIIVVDTGSTPENLTAIQSLRANDVEIHTVHAHGWRHASAPVAAAMDLATLLCETPYLFTTHADCFLMRRDVLAEMVPLAEKYEAVGYQITERHIRDWQYALGHTCTMFSMAMVDRIGMQWSMRRFYKSAGTEWDLPQHTGGWPDTESLFNQQLLAAGVRPYLFGTERNYQRNRDGTIDHCRSVPSASLYSPKHREKMAASLAEAITEAQARITAWKSTTPVS